MKRIIKKTGWPVPPLAGTLAGANDMSYEDMLLRAKEIMNREITHLMIASSEGKLDPKAANDLIQLVRVLQQLTKSEAEQAASLSEEQIKTALESKNE